LLPHIDGNVQFLELFYFRLLICCELQVHNLS
jgi:hypothetical protein